MTCLFDGKKVALHVPMVLWECDVVSLSATSAEARESAGGTFMEKNVYNGSTCELLSSVQKGPTKLQRDTFETMFPEHRITSYRNVRPRRDAESQLALRQYFTASRFVGGRWTKIKKRSLLRNNISPIDLNAIRLAAVTMGHISLTNVSVDLLKARRDSARVYLDPPKFSDLRPSQVDPCLNMTVTCHADHQAVVEKFRQKAAESFRLYRVQMLQRHKMERVLVSDVPWVANEPLRSRVEVILPQLSRRIPLILRDSGAKPLTPTGNAEPPNWTPEIQTSQEATPSVGCQDRKLCAVRRLMMDQNAAKLLELGFSVPPPPTRKSRAHEVEACFKMPGGDVAFSPDVFLPTFYKLLPGSRRSVKKKGRATFLSPESPS